MLRLLLTAAVCALLAHTALAADNPPAEKTVALDLTQNDLASWAQVPGAFDQCYAAMSLRGDSTMCRTVSVFLAQFSQRVAAVSQAPAPQPKPAEPPKAEDKPQAPVPLPHTRPDVGAP